MNSITESSATSTADCTTTPVAFLVEFGKCMIYPSIDQAGLCGGQSAVQYGLGFAVDVATKSRVSMDRTNLAVGGLNPLFEGIEPFPSSFSSCYDDGECDGDDHRLLRVLSWSRMMPLHL
jgi:hypothetical protein